MLSFCSELSSGTCTVRIVRWRLTSFGLLKKLPEINALQPFATCTVVMMYKEFMSLGLLRVELRDLCVYSGHYQKASSGLTFTSSLFAFSVIIFCVF